MNTPTSYENAALTRVQSAETPPPDAICTALVISARQDVALMGTLVAADEMAAFNLLQAEWQDHLASFPQFADDVEFADPYICSMSQLAELVAQAPTAILRQTLREIAYCREQMVLMLGLAPTESDERAEVVLAGASAEWEILLSVHPTFHALIGTIDRFTCSRTTLAELILHAPTSAIRHALRETFCFREVASLTTSCEFL